MSGRDSCAYEQAVEHPSAPEETPRDKGAVELRASLAQVQVLQRRERQRLQSLAALIEIVGSRQVG